VYDLDDNSHLSFVQGGGHGGSHPHLAHEFISALIEDREPFPNAWQSANWTSVGILAHESALQGGGVDTISVRCLILRMCKYVGAKPFDCAQGDKHLSWQIPIHSYTYK
jgi:hypothetical protein